MSNLLNWLEENVYHTTSCDTHRRTLGNPCICGKNSTVEAVKDLYKAAKTAQKAIYAAINRDKGNLSIAWSELDLALDKAEKIIEKIDKHISIIKS